HRGKVALRRDLAGALASRRDGLRRGSRSELHGLGLDLLRRGGFRGGGRRDLALSEPEEPDHGERAEHESDEEAVFHVPEAGSELGGLPRWRPRDTPYSPGRFPPPRAPPARIARRLRSLVATPSPRSAP